MSANDPYRSFIIGIVLGTSGRKENEKITLCASAIGALILGVSGYVAAQDKPVIATVVKISGIPWFNRMEVGVKAFQDANPDVVTSESGPATADAASRSSRT